MNDALKRGLFGVAAPLIDKFTEKSDSDARISALEKNNEDYKKQLADMQAAQTGQVGQPVKPMKKGGKVSSASKRADGCAIRGKTRA
jgi:hypothetical protein